MIYELDSYINGNRTRIFISNPLMKEKNITKVLHTHKYTEFHIVFGGNIKVLIENKKYIFSSGSVYSVPGGAYHCYIEAEPNTHIVAFQTDDFQVAFEKHSIAEAVIKEIIDILEKEDFYSDSSGISALFSFVMSAFSPSVQIKQSKDDAAVIYEFISKNYNQNITVSELAKKLYLSDRQTERLVKKYTGYTFKKAMMSYRIKVADFLEKNTDMNQSEISNYVGYSDYSGYWKAKKLFKNNSFYTDDDKK